MALSQVTELGTNVTDVGQLVNAYVSDSLDSNLPNFYGTQVKNMGYNTANGRYANTLAVSFGSATLTATAASNVIELGDRNSLRLDLVISAASGTSPTLDIAVQTSPDGTTWTTVASFSQQTTTTTGVHKLFGPIDRFVRCNNVLGGTTPSFTFQITGEAV